MLCILIVLLNLHSCEIGKYYSCFINMRSEVEIVLPKANSSCPIMHLTNEHNRIYAS